MATSEASTDTRGALEIAAVRLVGVHPSDEVHIVTMNLRDWPAILSDVVAALNYHSDHLHQIEIQDVEIQDNGDVRVRFDTDASAYRFMQFAESREI